MRADQNQGGRLTHALTSLRVGDGKQVAFSIGSVHTASVTAPVLYIKPKDGKTLCFLCTHTVNALLE